MRTMVEVLVRIVDLEEKYNVAGGLQLKVTVYWTAQVGNI